LIGSRGPAVDQFWRMTEHGFYAAGNVLRPVETAAFAAHEGALAGRSIAADLFGRSRSVRRVPIVVEKPVGFSTPSYIAIPLGEGNRVRLGLRMAAPARGRLTLAADGREFWRSAKMNLLPERRITITPELPPLDNVGEIRLALTQDG
jgi:hypothetical protein